jgi:hypothetical protein
VVGTSRGQTKNLSTEVLTTLFYIRDLETNSVQMKSGYIGDYIMRLLTWNAAMKFRDKIEYVLPFESDILVVPECGRLKNGRKVNLKIILSSFYGLGIILIRELGSLH